jgi:hypothetical protein
MTLKAPSRRAWIALGAASIALNAVFVGALVANVDLRGKLRSLVRGTNDEPTQSAPGRWQRRADGAHKGAAKDAELDEQLKQLQTIGYLAGSQDAPEQSDVTRHDPALAWEGLNFAVSGHAPEAVLMDMRGVVRHRWARDFRSVWPDYAAPKRGLNDQFWRRAHLAPNGNVLAIFEGVGLLELDARSNLLWAKQNGAHHDLFVSAAGEIYVLAREAKLLERYDPEAPILEEFVLVLDAKGEELRRVSVLRAFEESDFAPLLARIPRSGDVFHNNTIEVLDGALAAHSPAFRAGNVLISVLNLDLVAILDLDAERIVWALTGPWRLQHQPTMVADGRMLVLDNQGLGERSRVLELDPFSQQIHWIFEGTEDEPFFTRTCGSVQRLPNGNTLITESDAGRAFEVTRDKRIAWEFVSPHRAGRNGELIATLFDVVRLPPDFPTVWSAPANGR